MATRADYPAARARPLLGPRTQAGHPSGTTTAIDDRFHRPPRQVNLGWCGGSHHRAVGFQARRQRRRHLHAYRNPIRIFDLDDGFTMIIGANATAIIFEVGVIEGHTANVIVHAMRAREKYLR